MIKAVVMKSGNLDFLEPSGPPQACNGTALPFFTSWISLKKVFERCSRGKIVGYDLVLCLLIFTEGLKYRVYKENVQNFAGNIAGIYERLIMKWIYYINKPTWCNFMQSHLFFIDIHSTCFGRLLNPSSGVQSNCMSVDIKDLGLTKLIEALVTLLLVVVDCIVEINYI
jgi:hypothetical protein